MPDFVKSGLNRLWVCGPKTPNGNIELPKKQHETDRVQAFSTYGQQMVGLHMSLMFFVWRSQKVV